MVGNDFIEIEKLKTGSCHDPFTFLGKHETADGFVLRAFLPHAEKVGLAGGDELPRVAGTDLFVLKTKEQPPSHYELNWVEKHDGSEHRMICPYSFSPQISDFDLYLFNEGKHGKAWQFLGANPKTVDGASGVLFAVWAPGVAGVSVIGDFNGWHIRRHPMRSRGSSGVWELFIPGLTADDAYKFNIRTADGRELVKTDPYARKMGMRPDTVSLVCPASSFKWSDNQWMESRKDWDWQHKPVSIYEVHLGSWQKDDCGGFLTYRELAHRLVEHAQYMGYTHIELLPITEHPLDASWGYQVSGYFAPSARFGSPDELRYFINFCHKNNIGVILDWVPSHFIRDDFALSRFNGEALYEYMEADKGEHKEWGTYVFNYGRHEVVSFLNSSACYWLEEFHFDGLRVDAVASMLYLDYSRKDGEWSPNIYGGKEHIEAIDYLRGFNELIHRDYPGVLTIAEESTAWPQVSRPTWCGGLGFGMKWNLGWMHDTLNFFANDPVFRKYHHNELTFSQLYAYTENFVLALSHDEVVHGKRSLLAKMAGDNWQKFANLRLLYSYFYAHPGKKLLFMGGEFGQWTEWREDQSLEWHLAGIPAHRGIMHLVRDLNQLYKTYEALHCFDFSHEGFEWIDCNDTEQSIVSLLRKGGGREVIAVFNFTPVPRFDYRIGVNGKGEYREIFNSDSKYYGGTNTGNYGLMASDDFSWMGRPYSLKLALPPLAAIFLEISS